MAGGNEANDLQIIVFLAILLAGPPYLWWMVAQFTRRRYRFGTLRAHTAGALGGASATFVGLCLAAVWNGWALLVGIGLAVPIWKMHRTVRRARPETHGAALSRLDKSLFARTFGNPPPESAKPSVVEIETARLRSIAAMNGADIMSARARYIEQMHGAAARNSGSRVWESDDEPKRARSKRGGGRRPPAGKYVDLVRFDYEDRGGAETTREIEVTGINSEYLQGWCTTRRATRSFRLDRIIGEVVSMETGEVDSAYGWAAVHMNHPNNRGISDEGWYR